MKPELAERTPSSRPGTELGASHLLLAAALILLSLGRAPGAQTRPDGPRRGATRTARPSSVIQPVQEASSVAVTVNGHRITQEYFQKTIALYGVLSDFAGREPPTRADILQRLIRQEPILQGTQFAGQPTDSDVAAYIATMQEAWQIDDDAMLAALGAVAVDQTFLEDAVNRLLKAQEGLDHLVENGEDVDTWLREEETKAEIEIRAEPSELRAATPGQRDAIESPVSTAIDVRPDQPPTPTYAPRPSVPAVAPGFRLPRAGGGEFTLRAQLTRGPVVLVFFQRCG